MASGGTVSLQIEQPEALMRCAGVRAAVHMTPVAFFSGELT